MWLAFWRKRGDKPAAMSNVVSKPVKAPKADAAMSQLDDIDLRAVGHTLWRKRARVIVPTVVVAILSVIAVNAVTPRYKSETRILIDGRENIFLRPSGDRTEERSSLDSEAVTSQVQLLLSRDLARRVIAENKLNTLPEFDPVLRGVSPLKSILAMLGLGRDLVSLAPDERVLDAYSERLTAYAVEKSRVVVVEFLSENPELAARVANSIASGYIAMLHSSRQDQAKAATNWLEGEIEGLREKVNQAESKVEEFRSGSSLFIGTNNTSLSNQQLGELNTQLGNARALQSDADSKARLIRQLLQSGGPLEASDVLNSELIRRMSEQRASLRAVLAEQSSTLLDNHPRIKELRAQLQDVDRQIRDEASKYARSLENDARIAGGRVESLTNNLEQLKKQASSQNGQDVRLRALEREAKAQRDLLETYLAKYREASTRENIDSVPSDARVISRAVVTNSPAYPKKLPVIVIATLATFLLCAGVIVSSELLRMTAPAMIANVPPRARTIRSASAEQAASPIVTTPVAADVTPRPVVVTPAAPPPPVHQTPVPPVAPPAPSSATQRVEGLDDLLDLADMLNANRNIARKVTVVGTGENADVSSSALNVARLLGRHAKVVLVDLALPLPGTDRADRVSPGLFELLDGTTSFSQVLVRDTHSSIHLIGAGRQIADASVMQSPRLSLALDALTLAYEHVVLNAGNALHLPSNILTTDAYGVLVCRRSMTEAAKDKMKAELLAAGFKALAVLTEPVGSVDPIVNARGGKIAAA